VTGTACRPIHVALLGLGEAGTAFAADLIALGVPTAGWDPVPARSVSGLRRAESAGDAVAGADLVLSLNSGASAVPAAQAVAAALSSRSLFADLNTTGIAVKREIAVAVCSAGASFADVALLAPVPGCGLRTPALASGDGAGRYAEIMGSFGARVDVVGPEPGAAAARKLLRSVFMRGLAASVLESLAAAESAGCADWLREPGPNTSRTRLGICPLPGLLGRPCVRLGTRARMDSQGLRATLGRLS
jgi:3-hydroxyisobutyrate dehydrogenase-like beta-hydroxyacid dehydrogenase